MAERADDVWDLVHAERTALIHDLEGLTDEQWRTPSLCPGWTVHDVAAHLVGNAGPSSVPGILAALVRARFSFDRMNEQDAARHRGAGPADTLRGLREVAGLTAAPPFVPLVVRGGRERAAGVRLLATDCDLAIGDGPEVSGPAASLLVAISGRRAARDDLAGPGLAALG